MSTWVKSPIFKKGIIYIVSECLVDINPELISRFNNEGLVLTACPESEGYQHYGKIAVIWRSNKKYIKEIRLVTVDGSPHCFTLHASLNEAEYLVGEKIPSRHYVYIDGKLIEIDPNSIRLARYLHIIDKLYKENMDYVKRELSKYSLEFKASRT